MFQAVKIFKAVINNRADRSGVRERTAPNIKRICWKTLLNGKIQKGLNGAASTR